MASLRKMLLKGWRHGAEVNDVTLLMAWKVKRESLSGEQQRTENAMLEYSTVQTS